MLFIYFIHEIAPELIVSTPMWYAMVALHAGLLSETLQDYAQIRRGR
jgi:hypothetical protein